MGIERSLVLIKPDAVERNLIGKVLEVYEQESLTVKDMKMDKISKEFAKKHYEKHKDTDYFDRLINYITRSKLVAVVLEGENAISKIRTINGSINSQNDSILTIRRRFALSKTENTVHASDSIDSAKREISLWFPENYK